MQNADAPSKIHLQLVDQVEADSKQLGMQQIQMHATETEW
jgi:hypothetical protein